MKHILITGNSKGLGKYMTEKLGDDFQVFGVARSFRKTRTLEQENYLDLTDFEQFDDFCEKLAEKNMLFDGIILNAGKGVFGKFCENNAKIYEEILQLNLVSPIIFLQKLLPFLKEDAKIIFIGSIISKKFLPNGAVYGASKFGLRGFAGILNKELKNKVHIINPRILQTDFHTDSTVEIPKNQITSFEDILQVVHDIFSKTEQRFEIDL
ncbi:SDR family oxidoreductase [Candidatus Gracilibacteria bacterium]|nr:SDR family oxidoreductase [Candidatus Gracilibacteria bacterium]